MTDLPPEIEERAESEFSYEGSEYDFSNEFESFKSGARWLWTYLSEMPKLPTSGYEKKLARTCRSLESEIEELRAALEGALGFSYKVAYHKKRADAIRGERNARPTGCETRTETQPIGCTCATAAVGEYCPVHLEPYPI